MFVHSYACNRQHSNCLQTLAKSQGLAVNMETANKHGVGRTAVSGLRCLGALLKQHLQ